MYPFLIRDALSTQEISDYRREMRHRPVMINTATVTTTNNGRWCRKRKNRQTAYHTRSTRSEEPSEGVEPEPVSARIKIVFTMN